MTLRNLLWPSFVFFIIALCLTGTGSLIYFATSDPTFAVEPDYYQKALAWDQTARQREASKALGWEIDANVPAETSPAGAHHVVARFTARSGEIIAGAAVACSAFSNAHASQRHELSFLETDPGHYRAELPIGARGLWHLIFTAQRGSESFTAELDLSVGPAAERAEQRP